MEPRAFLARYLLSFSALATHWSSQRYHSTGPWIHLPLFMCCLRTRVETSLADMDNNCGIWAQVAACFFLQNCWRYA